MQNFFGFIDYNKNNFSLNHSNENQILFENKNTKHSFFLLSNKHQQIDHIEQHKYFIFFMGKISNQLFLTTALSLPKTTSIIKILEKAYTHWGIEFIKQIEGSFSLVIYNKEKNMLTLYKDKIGKQPLYFYHSEQGIIFSSTLKNFKKIPYFKPIVNPKSLASYLQFGCILQPNTIWESCYKIESGHYINFDLNHNSKTDIHYWSLESCYQKPKTIDSEKDIINTAHSILEESIQNISFKSNNIAVSLSGGYDSSTLTALLQKQYPNKINSFTIGFNEEHINEAKDAKRIAQHLGTQHHEHYFTAKDALKIVPKLAQIYDEPFAEYAATPTVLTAQLIQEQEIGDIFVGDGGDEVFATADDVGFFDRIQTIPYSARKFLLNPLKKIPIDTIPYIKEQHNLPTKYLKLLNTLSSENIPQMVESRNILFREKELQQLVQNYQTPIETSFNSINFNGYQESVDEIIGTYFKTTMTDGELVKSYSSMNHHNISLHTPFLNEKLVEYMATIPASIKIKNGIKKYILKEIAYQYIPKPLLHRPKSGFDIPFSSWMKKELKELVYEQINEKRLNEDKLFYTSSILKIRDNFYNGNEAFKYKLWRIFIFQLWYQHFKG